MCRLAAYTGPSILLEQFLLAPEHGLVVQSYAPREMRTGRVNADGYGVGWLSDEGPARLIQDKPIWADHNLPTLSRVLCAPTWLAAVRGATPGLANHPANTQPFLADGLLFAHNGFIDDFGVMRARIRHQLSPQIESSIEGTTDSEYLFALIRQIRADGIPDLADALAALAGRLADALGTRRAQVNIILAEDRRLHALRHAYNEAAPSLHFTTDDEEYPSGLLIASEATTNGSYWQTVPENHILTLDPDRPAELVALS